MKLRKGDTVKILSGRDAGKTGKVLKSYPDAKTVLVEGLNLVKKHLRPKKGGEKGSITSVPLPMSLSKVMVVCPKCGKPARIGIKTSENSKLRQCKKCHQEF